MTQRELVIMQANRSGYEAIDVAGRPLKIDEVDHCAAHITETVPDSIPQLGSWWFQQFELSNSNWEVVGYIGVHPITTMDEYQYPAAYKVPK